MSIFRQSLVVRTKGVERTKQSMKDQCDINRIMARYLKTGAVDHVAKHGGDYGFASSQSFHDAMNVVAKAEQMFADLPSNVRKRFANDPAQFLEFVQDAKNAEECVKLGLAVKKPAEAKPAPVEVAIVSGSTSSSAPAPSSSSSPAGAATQ